MYRFLAVLPISIDDPYGIFAAVTISGHGAPPPGAGGDGSGPSGSGRGTLRPAALPRGQPLPAPLAAGLPGMATDPFGLALAAVPFDRLTASLQQQLQAHEMIRQQQQQQEILAAQLREQQAQQNVMAAQALQQRQHNAQAKAKQVALKAAVEKQKQSGGPLLPAFNALQKARPRARASKEEYIGVMCHICGAAADGMHYNAVSCRSCNAFFRRAVSFEHTYVCRYDNNCEVNLQLRCACRACRYRKCVEAGMRDKAVQPPRDPTGSQKDKKKPAAGSRKRRHDKPPQQLDGLRPLDLVRQQQIMEGAGPSGMSQESRAASSNLTSGIECYSDFDDDDDDYLGEDAEDASMQQALYRDASTAASRRGSPARGRKRTAAGSQAGESRPVFIDLVKEEQERKKRKEEMRRRRAEGREGTGAERGGGTRRAVKRRVNAAIGQLEPEDADVAIQAVVEDATPVLRAVRDRAIVTRPWREETPLKDYERFKWLITCYHEHTRMMQTAMTPLEDYMTQHDTDQIVLRQMVPGDVSQLSTTELAGLLYWIEKQGPYKKLGVSDRRALFKRFSVRKLSLDHFFTASKWDAEIARGNFVMLNNTFVPPDRTGFELETDDEKQIKAKAEILLPTFEQMWRAVIRPFAQMNISEAEIIFLHALMLWSPLNHTHVLESTKPVMKAERDWNMRMLWEHYLTIGQEDPEVRMGQVIALLAEIEVVCDRHCQDFQVARLFEFCDMSQFWYEKWCYSAPIRPEHTNAWSRDLRATGVYAVPREDEDVNTMRVAMSPARNEAGETVAQAFDKELAKRLQQQDLLMLSTVDPAVADPGPVPAKRSRLSETSPTPSTPQHQFANSQSDEASSSSSQAIQDPDQPSSFSAQLDQPSTSAQLDQPSTSAQLDQTSTSAQPQ